MQDLGWSHHAAAGLCASVRADLNTQIDKLKLNLKTTSLSQKPRLWIPDAPISPNINPYKF